MFTKQGLSVIRIVSIFLISVALVLQVTAVAADKWSEIDSDYRGLPIKAYQSLWTERVLLDKPHAYPRPKNMENGKMNTTTKEDKTCVFYGSFFFYHLVIITLPGPSRGFGFFLSCLVRFF